MHLYRSPCSTDQANLVIILCEWWFLRFWSVVIFFSYFLSTSAFWFTFCISDKESSDKEKWNATCNLGIIHSWRSPVYAEIWWGHVQHIPSICLIISPPHSAYFYFKFRRLWCNVRPIIITLLPIFFADKNFGILGAILLGAVLEVQFDVVFRDFHE